jgi:hypothetical protein
VASEPEGSSPHSQQPANGPYPEPGESTAFPPANLPKVHFDPILPSTPWSSRRSLSSDLSHQILLHFSPLSHACHMSHPPHARCLMISGDEYELWSSPLFNFLHSPVTSSLLGPNIPLCTLFSSTLSLCSSLNVRDQISHPYQTTGRSMVCIFWNLHS